MILNVDNEYGGKFSCKIIDANGLEWTYVVECDTKTGRIERYVPHLVTGKPYLAADGLSIVREIVYGAPPLVAVSLESKL